MNSEKERNVVEPKKRQLHVVEDGRETAANSYHEVEDQLHKKVKREAANVVSPCPGTANTNPATDYISQQPAEKQRCGRWTLDEKIMFLYGLSVFGKGRWKKIHDFVPDRSLVQIKSHAQKVLKRLEAGENIFRRLDDNRERLKQLIAETNERMMEKEEARVAALSSGGNDKKKRKRNTTRKPSPISIDLPASWDLHFPSLMSKVREKAVAVRNDSPRFGSGSSTPSLSPEDPPGLVASQYLTYPREMVTREQPPSWSRSSSLSVSSQQVSRAHADMDLPAAGTGAVIAAVAALCQLSAAAPSPSDP